MKVLFLFIFAGLSVAAARTYTTYDLEAAAMYFKEFIKTFIKEYANEVEKQMRFEIFKKNLEIINKMNLDSTNAVFGITFFSDLTTEEFLSTYTGYISGGLQDNNCQQQTPHLTGNAPDSFDWRDQNVVSSVKNQLNCGSCYAFSTSGNLESQYAKKYNTILEVSEQQIVDCDQRSSGCNGTHDMGNPAMYWMENGAMLDQDYPYIGAVGSCNYDASKVKVKVSGCVVYKLQSEDDLKETLYQVGPLAITVDATSVHGYHGKVLQDCQAGPTNHAVLLVGYGTEDGDPYWLIKNSWGASWGESGYFKIKRGVNACNIMQDSPVTALVE